MRQLPRTRNTGCTKVRILESHLDSVTQMVLQVYCQGCQAGMDKHAAWELALRELPDLEEMFRNSDK